MRRDLPDHVKGAILLGGVAALALAAVVFLLLPRFAPDTAGAHERTPPPAADEGRNWAEASAPPPRPRAAGPGRLEPPDSTEMTLTVPALDRVDGVRVKSAPGSEDGPLRYGAMHVLGTGYPWQPNQNTYIAGHRLGFPGTPSDRLFWDLDDLKTGDTVLLTDADDRRYEYRVFQKRVVGPEDISVAKPVPGKDVVSLQTCTLPDYSERLVVQAELVDGPGGLPGPTPEAYGS